MKLLSTANPKVLKGQSQGYNTFILHLSPANVSGYETCAKRTAGCTAACLNTAGHGGMFKKGETTNVVQEARKRRTRMFFELRDVFMFQLVKEIKNAIKLSAKQGMTPVFRLNGTSDLAWEKYEVLGRDNIFELFPDIQFYDYTKVLGRKVAHLPNYHLTFSAADGNDADVAKAIEQGMNVAMVFDKLPAEYNGRKVHDADEHDLRFMDPIGGIAGLKAKGKARKDKSGFVTRA